MTLSRYIIHHLDLSGEHDLACSSGDAGHYYVFWYRSIPLGELYVTSSSGLRDGAFWERCLGAIRPALTQHAAARGWHDDALTSCHPEPASIRQLCADILEGLHPEPCPGEADVSVVICTRDRADELDKCLHSLKEQHMPPAEIIVVDNGSAGDETRKVAECFQVRYIREEVAGLDVARNTGARAASGQIVAYTDDDTRPDRYWVYRISETFRNPAIAAMTGLVIAASLNTEAEVIFERYWPFNRGYRKKIFDEQFFRTSLEAGPPVWKIGAGANMAFRRTVFERTGYFDERLDVGAAGCSGDSELWYRMLAAGLTIEYNPLAVVCHSHRRSMPALRRQLYSYMRGFTVAILVQYQRFGHRGNLRHLFRELPPYYLFRLIRGFPKYSFQYGTLFAEMTGILSGLFYFARHRNTDPKIYSHDPS